MLPQASWEGCFPRWRTARHIVESVESAARFNMFPFLFLVILRFTIFGQAFAMCFPLHAFLHLEPEHIALGPCLYLLALALCQGVDVLCRPLLFREPFAVAYALAFNEPCQTRAIAVSVGIETHVAIIAEVVGHHLALFGHAVFEKVGKGFCA